LAGLDHDHPCFRQGCPYFVHCVCAQMHDLLENDNELNTYCSMRLSVIEKCSFRLHITSCGMGSVFS
jgi:hypothetical protein